MDINELYLHQFKSFLLKAKLHGYAGGDRLKIRSSDFSKKYLYEEDEFSYEDRYFGEFVDMGQEIVRYKGIPVWGMSYRGGIFSLYDDNKQKVFNFLRLALNEVDNQLPIRGPSLYQNGTYTYKNCTLGDLMSFTGHEEIWEGNEQICFRYYLGGMIRGRYNKEMKVI